jgi:hypothetical protein
VYWRELLGQVAAHPVAMILLKLLQPRDLGFEGLPLLGEITQHGRALPVELDNLVGLRAGRRSQLFSLALT